jgi:two-component system sensor histidine kinase KdpD
MEPPAAERGHRIVVDAPDELPPVLLDYSKVDQVLTNLLENAIKFSPPGADVRVRASVADGELRVSVEDSGPGLPAVERERVFEPFYRGRGAAARGSGVGLTIAAGLVRAHGGRIWSEPRDGGGTIFTFSIPAGPEASST